MSPQLVAYVTALAITWFVAALTWSVGSDGRLELAPTAQALQYLLVALAATLAGHRVLTTERSRDPAAVPFGWGRHRWEIVDDVGGRTWWACIGAGIAAMVLNVLLLIAAEVVVGHAVLASAVADYFAWLGGAVASGALIGSFAALIAATLARLTCRGRRRLSADTSHSR